MLLAYIVNGIRVTRPSDKAQNPDVVMIVKGTSFAEADIDAAGNVTPVADGGLSITSKEVTREQALGEGFRLDLAKGILVIPSKERGRPKVASLSTDDVESLLAELRETPATDVEEEAGENPDSDPAPADK